MQSLFAFVLFFYIAETNGWLKLHTIPATFHDAWLRCSSEGAVLASPSNTFIESAMQKEMKKRHVSTGEVFTGIHATFSKGDFFSMDGIPLNDMQLQWMPNEPDNKNNDEECILYNANKTIADIRCSEIHPYFCYKENNSSHAVTNACGAVDKDCEHFRSDYFFHCETNGWLKLHQIPATFQDAWIRCRLEGAVLASPSNTFIESAMQKEMKNRHVSTGEAFIGIHVTPLNDMQLQWMPNEPANKNNDEECILYNANKTISDIRCSEIHPYFCYKEHNSELFVTECGTVDKEYNLDTRTGNCYKFHKHAQNWTRAFMTCSAEGGHLAVINSATEDDILKEMFAKNFNESIFYALPTKHKDVMHIGFHDRNEIGIWTTIHGTLLGEAGFELWGSGQPDNYAPGEHCGGMAKNGKLYDIGCDWLTPFICEKSPEWLQKQ